MIRRTRLIVFAFAVGMVCTSQAEAGQRVSRAELDDMTSVAVEQFNQGNSPQAISALKRCIAIDSRFARCHRTLGLILGRTGQRQQAARALRAYLQLSPRAADAARVRDLVHEYEL